MAVAPMSKEAPRVSATVSRDELTELRQLAHRCNTSVSALTHLALRHLLLQARAGAIPMLPPADLATAIEVDGLGRPL